MALLTKAEASMTDNCFYEFMEASDILLSLEGFNKSRMTPEELKKQDSKVYKVIEDISKTSRVRYIKERAEEIRAKYLNLKLLTTPAPQFNE